MALAAPESDPKNHTYGTSLTFQTRTFTSTYLSLLDPDPERPNICGSGGSGSRTLLAMIPNRIGQNRICIRYSGCRSSKYCYFQDPTSQSIVDPGSMGKKTTGSRIRIKYQDPQQMPERMISICTYSLKVLSHEMYFTFADMYG
jgi:hypothetical protein